MTGSDPRESSPARLHLRCPSFQEFIEEYSPRISSEGILLPVEGELAEGTPVEFEITLSDDFRVLRGGGKVAWFASADEAAEAGAGLAVSFTNLDNPGRRLIDRLVERHRADGGQVFSLVRWPHSTDTEAAAVAAAASEAPLLPNPEPPLGASQEVAPEIILSSAEADLSTHREAQSLSPGRPSRTPAGEDSVLIPAPALDGEPLPAESRPPESAHVEPPELVEPTWETVASSSAVEPPPEGLEGSPVDTLHVPPVPKWEGRSTSAVDPAELAMETVRVESFEPLTPIVEPYRRAEPETDLPHRPPTPMAGVGRAGSSRASRRRVLLLLLLALLLAAVWVVRSDRAAPLWDRLTSRSAASSVEPSAGSAPPARGAATAGAQGPTGPVEGTVSESGLAPPEPGSGIPLEAAPAPTTESSGTPSEQPRAAQVATPTESAPAAEASAVARAPLTRVLAIESEQRSGETEVRLIADGRFTEGAFNGTRVQGGSPRILIRVLGVAEPYVGSTVEIGSPEVTRVRVGVHQTGSRTDLHFVADLTSDGIRLVSADAEGTILTLRFAR